MKKINKKFIVFENSREFFFNILSVCHVKDTMTLHSNDNDDDAKKIHFLHVWRLFRRHFTKKSFIFNTKK